MTPRIGGTLAEYEAEALATGAADEFPRDLDLDKVRIDVGQHDLTALTNLCWEAIKKQNGDETAGIAPRLFLFNGLIVRAVKEDGGRLKIEAVTIDILGHALDSWAHWYSFKKIGKEYAEVPAFPSERVLRNVLATPEPELPVLRRIVSVPVFTSDGRLNLKPGFDWRSGIYYWPTGSFVAESVPDVIGQEQLDFARKVLCEELLLDFPFAEPVGYQHADRDNAIALAVLGAVREMIGGSTPNHAIEASIRSAGKGKLARALAGIFAGEELASTPPLENETDWKRLITSKLYTGAPVLLVDNIERPLRSASLASAWTEPFWEDIVFHKQTTNRVPVRTIWITTANNMVMHEDLMTRSIRIRLEPKTSKPEDRTGFRHDDLDLWCRDNRNVLVWAVHVLVLWWMQQGRPAPTKIRSTRHAEWCRVVGGILSAAGFNDFLGNQVEFQHNAAQGVDAAAAFCSQWWFERGEIPEGQKAHRPTPAAKLLEIARKVDDFPITENKDGQTRAMGLWLNSVRDRHIESEEDLKHRRIRRMYVIRRHPTYVKGSRPWLLERVGDDEDIGEARGDE